jgi:hypothetical protein
MRTFFTCVVAVVLVCSAPGCKSDKGQPSAKKARNPAPAAAPEEPILSNKPLDPAPAPATDPEQKTKERFKKIVKDRMPLLRKCYEQRNLGNASGPQTRAMLTVSITAEGKLDRAQVEIRDHIRDARFTRCVEKELEVMELPPPGKAVVIRYPIALGK